MPDTQKIDFMHARMMRQEEERKTLSLSRPSADGYARAIAKVGVKIDAPEWRKDTNTKNSCSQLESGMGNFRWNKGTEDSQDNRRKYMAYLKNKINLPNGSKIFDGAKAGNFLSTVFESMGIKTKGNIDVVMAAERHQKIATASRHMWAGLELKRQDNNSHGEIRRQVVLQHLSASVLNENRGVLTIMTDLGTRWHFYWFSKGQDAFMEYEATSKGEANYLIRHMKDAAGGTTSAPTDFLNRASWNEMFPPSAEIMNETERGGDTADGERGGEDGGGKKRARRGPQSPEGGGGARETAHATALSLSFMDEEEEKEARIRGVLQCILPQLGLRPSQVLQQDHHAEVPPSHIVLQN